MSAKDFLAGVVIDTAEALGATGISQTDGFVNTVINYLAPSRPPPPQRGFSQLGGFFSAPDRVPRRNAPSSTYWESAERAGSRVISRKRDAAIPASYQGRAFYENRDTAIDELRQGMARGDNKFVREDAPFAPPTRAAPSPFSPKTAQKIRRGLDREDEKYVREKPSVPVPKRKPRNPRTMQPPSLQG